MALTRMARKWEEGYIVVGIPDKRLGGVTTVGEPSGCGEALRHGKL
jgi:hypothetical protein